MISDADDRPHQIAPQVYMPWKENWCFSGVDPENATAVVWHISLRPTEGEGIFTCKVSGPDIEHRYVGRSPIPSDPADMQDISDGRLALQIVKPLEEFQLHFSDEEREIECLFTNRFSVFDFADGALAPGRSPIGDLGRHVFPFHHYEQAMRFTMRISDASGERTFSGFGNRDHSWGWRNDFGFQSHHWVCANFPSRYVQGSTMIDVTYPGRKHGGFISTDSGNTPVIAVDVSDTYWEEPFDEPLPELEHDVSYVLLDSTGETTRVTAHLADAYRRLYLNARHPNRNQVYQDVQVFCPFSLSTGEEGHGLLELGKRLLGEGIADRVGRRATA